MTYMNPDINGGASRRFRGKANGAEARRAPGFMPAHIFLRLFLSALAASLAVHFWRHGGR